MSPLRHIDVTVTYTVIVTSQLHHQDIFSMTLSLTNPYEPQYSLPISYPEERQKEQTDILFSLASWTLDGFATRDTIPELSFLMSFLYISIFRTITPLNLTQWME